MGAEYDTHVYLDLVLTIDELFLVVWVKKYCLGVNQTLTHATTSKRVKGDNLLTHNILKYLVQLFCFILLVLLMQGCSFPPHSGPVSDHFDGRQFHNLEPVSHPGLWGYLKYQLDGQASKWPENISADLGPKPPARVDGSDVRYTVINHSTVLIQVGNVNILTDPIWSQRCSLVSWAGPKRVRPPGLAIDQVPPIDIILVSHNHHDHMDLPTLLEFYKRDHPIILMGLGNAKFLIQQGIESAAALDWWQSIDTDGLVVSFVPSQHWSRRALERHPNTSLWGSFVIESEYCRIFFCGDTGYNSLFKLIKDKYGPMDLAFLPIGHYEPRWFMKDQHMNPQEALQVHFDLNSSRSVGIHFGTFQLSNEGIDQPVKDLNLALQQRKEELGTSQFMVPEFGTGYVVPFSSN